MGERNAQIRTTLEVKECAAVFAEASQSVQGLGSKLGGIAARATGNDNSGFYTPIDNSPFSVLDDDKPAFTVGVFIPRFAAGGQGAGSHVHMYVWDRGDHREVQLHAPHGFGGGGRAAKLVEGISRVFAGADRSARVVHA